MKKLILAFAALIASAAIVSAQDMAQATETYNAGVEALGIGDKAGALAQFQQALAMGLECGEEGPELVSNCKVAIPGIILSIGKELYNMKKFDEALEKVKEAQAIAKEYGNEEVELEAEALVAQVAVQKNLTDANNLFKNKDFAAATELYKAVLEAEPTNKAASIRLVQALANSGDLDGAKAAYQQAVDNGKEADAQKVLGGAFLKKAAAALKAGKAAEAIAAAEESIAYEEDAKAYQIAGQASYKLKKDGEAIKYFEKFLALAPTASNAGQIALTVGALYQGQKNKAKALEYYKKAQELGADAKAYIDALSK